MVLESLLNSEFFLLIVIPILIFLARVIDVSLGTIRVIFISKGFKIMAPLLGFFEVLIWLVAVRQLLTEMTHWTYFIAYAGGFAAGTFVGIYIEDKLSIGKVVIRIVSKKDPHKLFRKLEEEKSTITSTNADSNNGKVKVIYTIVKRQDIGKVLEITKKHDHDAFYSISDVRFARDEILTTKSKKYFNLFGFYRKAK